MSLICKWVKSHFHMKGWAPRLALKKRFKEIRKWPVVRQPFSKQIKQQLHTRVRLGSVAWHSVTGMHQREITTIVPRKMAEGGRNTRLPSGHAEDFVNAVEEDLQCSICHFPLKEPVLTRCGHRFCKEYLEEQFKRLFVILRILRYPVDCELCF